MDLALETPRLRIRPLVAADLDALHAVLGDPETMRFYPHPFSREEVAGWIKRSNQRYERDGFGLFALVDRATGELVGDCGPVLQRVEDERHVELGWHVRRDRWGQGLATEAAEVCRDWAFANLDVDHLISLVRKVNVASGRVAAKLGMTVARSVTYAGLPHDMYWLDRPT